MSMGAERMCMPSPSLEQFIDAVTQTVLANKRFVRGLFRCSIFFSKFHLRKVEEENFGLKKKTLMFIGPSSGERLVVC